MSNTICHTFLWILLLTSFFEKISINSNFWTKYLNSSERLSCGNWNFFRMFKESRDIIRCNLLVFLYERKFSPIIIFGGNVLTQELLEVLSVVCIIIGVQVLQLWKNIHGLEQGFLRWNGFNLLLLFLTESTFSSCKCSYVNDGKDQIS